MLLGFARWAATTRKIDSIVVVAEDTWAFGIWRDGLVFDSRFVCAATVPRGLATVYLVASGWVEPRGAARVDGPSLWVLAEDEFECVGADSSTFRSGGSPAAMLGIFVPAAQLTTKRGLVTGPRPLDARLVAAIGRLHEAPLDDKKDAFCSVVEALVEDGVLAPSVATQLRLEEPSPIVRLWDAVAGLYQHHDTTAYLDLLSSIVGLSPRQVQRDLGGIAARMGFGGFRDALRYTRLRRAALLLSAPEIPIADIAKLVGYGSGDAMARAFRDADLPAPRVVREQLSEPQ